MRRRLHATLTAIAAVAAFLLVGCGGRTVASRVGDVKGEPVDCGKSGAIAFAGTSADVYECWQKNSEQRVGCFTVVRGSVYDVSRPYRLVTGRQCRGWGR